MFEINYVLDSLYGNAIRNDFDAYVAYWHMHDIQKTLEDFLGFTEYEYEEILKNWNTVARDILICRINIAMVRTAIFIADEATDNAPINCRFSNINRSTHYTKMILAIYEEL